MKCVIRCQFDCVYEGDEKEALSDIAEDIMLYFDDVEEITLEKIGHMTDDGDFVRDREAMKR